MSDEIKNTVRKAILVSTVFIAIVVILLLYIKNKIVTLDYFSDMQTAIFNFILTILIVMMIFMTFCYVYISILIVEYKKEKNIAKTAIDSSGLYHIKVTGDGKICWCNDNFVRGMKSSQDELINHTLSNFANLTNDKLLTLLNCGETFTLNLYNNQKILYVTCNIIKCKSKGRAKWEIIGQDISDIINKDLKIFQMDFEDELTGMYNTKKFLLEGNLLVQSDKEFQYTVICIAIKRFRELVNIRGTSGGDEIIKVIAEALKKANSIYSDIITARTGIDTFVILVRGENAESSILFNDIIRIINKNLVRNKFGEDIRFSNGAAIYPKNGTFLENVLEKAELTLKNSKDLNSQDLMFYDKDIIKIILDNRILESKLIRAFELEEFQLYYQPKVDIKTGRLAGREALMRWNDSKEGIIPPSEFIPLAEKIGLVKDLDDWGLKEACIQNAFWHKNNIGPKVSVSVNICAKEFYNGDIVKRVKEALDESGLEPQYLDIELTESMTMMNIEEVTNKLTKLKALGVSISLDDFGTGYSSMSYLKKLPIDIIKLDKSFIDDIAKSDKSKSIVGAIIGLAISLGIDTLAEGIENEVQNDILVNLKCLYGQGYLYGRPVSATDITKDHIYNSKDN